MRAGIRLRSLRPTKTRRCATSARSYAAPPSASKQAKTRNWQSNRPTRRRKSKEHTMIGTFDAVEAFVTEYPNALSGKCDTQALTAALTERFAGVTFRVVYNEPENMEQYRNWWDLDVYEWGDT